MVYDDAYRLRDFNAPREDGRVVTLNGRDYRIVLCGVKHEPGVKLDARHITVARTHTGADTGADTGAGVGEYVALIRRKSGAHDYVIPTRDEMLALFKGEAITLCTRLIRKKKHDTGAADAAPVSYSDPAFHEIESLCGQKYKLPKILPRVFQIVYKTCVRNSRPHPSVSWSEEAIAQRKSTMAKDKTPSPEAAPAVRAQYASSALDMNKFNGDDDFIDTSVRKYTGGELNLPLRAKIMDTLSSSGGGSAPAAAAAKASAAPRKKSTPAAAAAGVVPTVVANATAGAKKRKSAPTVAEEAPAPAPPQKKPRTISVGPSTKQVNEFYKKFELHNKQFTERMTEFYKEAGLTKKATIEDKNNALLSTFREQCDKQSPAMPSLGANFFFAYTIVERFREQERAREMSVLRDKAAKWDAAAASAAAASLAAAAAPKAAALINKKAKQVKQPIRKIFDDDDDDDDNDNDDDDDDDDGSDQDVDLE